MIEIRKNGITVDEYVPSYQGQHIVIAIDSSKSNTAMFVADHNGGILDDYEISGAGSDTNVYDLCKFTRKQLRTLFYGADILYVGIEDIITKKEVKNGKEFYGGVDIHESRRKITAVFDSMIFLFDDEFDVRPELINNWEWKADVLPEAYRTRGHHKGSKDWFKSCGNPYGSRKDDITDALCILMHIFNKHKFVVKERIINTLPTAKKYNYFIYPEGLKLPKVKQFVVANNDSLIHNIETVVEKCPTGAIGTFLWDIEKLPIDIIYSDRLSNAGNITFTIKDKQVLVCVEVK